MINLYSNVIICQLKPRKDENKEKEAGKGPFKKKYDAFELPSVVVFELVFSEVLQTSFELKPSSTQIRRSGSSSQHLNQWPQIQTKLSILVAL